jgi:hypothetical protein
LFNEENLNGFNILSEFLVDAEGFVIELILVLLSNFGEFLTIIVIKSIDVVHHSALIGLNGCQNQQVLKISVISESGVVENNSLKQLNQLMWEFSGHESLDSA